MVRQKEAIHAVPSAWFRWPPPGSAWERSKTPMLSSPRKPPPKTWRPSTSLRLTHQVKLSSSFWKRAFEEEQVAVALVVGDLVDPPDGPGVDRRIDVGEVPLVGRELAVRVHVPLAQQQQELVFREVRIDRRRRGSCGTRCPRRRTTGIPTCPASRGCRGRRSAASRNCARDSGRRMAARRCRP